MPTSDLEKLSTPELHRVHAERYKKYQDDFKALQAIKHPTPYQTRAYRESEAQVQASNAELERRDREAAKSYYRNHHHA